MKTIFILTLAALMSTANAQRATRVTSDSPESGRDRDLKTILELDDATAEKIEKLRIDYQKNLITLRAKMKTVKVDFRSMMKKDTPDESAILSKQKEIFGIKSDIRESGLKHRFAVAKLLTAEQKELLREHRGRGIGKGRRDGLRGRGTEKHGSRSFRKHRKGSRGMKSCCR